MVDEHAELQAKLGKQLLLQDGTTTAASLKPRRTTKLTSKIENGRDLDLELCALLLGTGHF